MARSTSASFVIRSRPTRSARLRPGPRAGVRGSEARAFGGPRRRVGPLPQPVHPPRLAPPVDLGRPGHGIGLEAGQPRLPPPQDVGPDLLAHRLEAAFALVL